VRPDGLLSRSARYYDAIYAARGKDYEAEARRVSGLVHEHGRSNGNRLLDVACGTGGHLGFFKDEFQVEGLDLDRRMLEIARKGLPGIPLHHADMADFHLASTFDAVVCLFSSIAYCDTYRKMQRAVSTMAGHAKPGGLVIIEPWFYPGGFSRLGVHAVFVDQPELKIARMNRNSVRNGVSILNFHYPVATPGRVHRFRETHRLGLFTHEKHCAALQAAQLEVVHDAHGLDGRGLFIGIKASPK
jgi:SAM-dependent methyltransferase